MSDWIEEEAEELARINAAAERQRTAWAARVQAEQQEQQRRNAAIWNRAQAAANSMVADVYKRLIGVDLTEIVAHVGGMTPPTYKSWRVALVLGLGWNVIPATSHTEGWGDDETTTSYRPLWIDDRGVLRAPAYDPSVARNPHPRPALDDLFPPAVWDPQLCTRRQPPDWALPGWARRWSHVPFPCEPPAKWQDHCDKCGSGVPRVDGWEGGDDPHATLLSRRLVQGLSALRGA